MPRTLREANIERNKEWNPNSVIELSFRGTELAGEVGEACNVIKKLERERLGLRGSRATKEQLAEELADVVICADLTALDTGIDLDQAIQDKFNATSEKNGLKTRLDPTEPIFKSRHVAFDELRINVVSGLCELVFTPGASTGSDDDARPGIGVDFNASHAMRISGDNKFEFVEGPITAGNGVISRSDALKLRNMLEIFLKNHEAGIR